MKPQMTRTLPTKTKRYADECTMFSAHSTAMLHAPWVYLAVFVAWDMSGLRSMRHTWGNQRCCWLPTPISIFSTSWATHEKHFTWPRREQGLNPLLSSVPGNCRNSSVRSTDGCKSIPHSLTSPTTSFLLVQSKSLPQFHRLQVFIH